MKLATIRQLIIAEQTQVDQLIIDGLHSSVPLIAEIGQYIINNGGKRLRPIIVLLSALACAYEGKHHCSLAAIIEFIHTATLLHDDVVDASTLRRGQETANTLWGDQSSVLVGDFLYSRAFQMMVAIDNMDVMRILADTTNIISEGEVLQLLNAHNANASEADYFKVITCKTAKLFAAAAELGGVIAMQNQTVRQQLAEYGLNFGIAYQLIDDVLDYASSAAQMGKNVGDDLAEGKLTLPLLHVLKNGTAQQAGLVHTAITQGSLEHLAKIQEAIAATDALAYTSQQAQYYAKRAQQNLDILPDSPYKQALLGLTEFIVERNY